MRRHGGACQCCGATRSAGAQIHVDHIKPRSKYPELELDIENLQVLCGDCNLGKSNKYIDDWRYNSQGDKMLLKNGDDYYPTDEELNALRRAYPNVDIDAEIAKMDMWCLANRSKRKVNGLRFVQNWLSRCKPEKDTSTRRRTLHQDLTDTSWAE